ncbi:MAG: peptidoglycan DD-metalloendopeptidase family protein [Candidatus Buchananbacteria bacterium]
MLKKSLIYSTGFLLILFLFVFISQNALAATSNGGPDQAVIDQLNKQLNEQQKKIDEITGKIDQYKASIKDVRGQAITLKNQVTLLDNQIGTTNLEIQSKEEEIKQTELQIQKVKLEIKQNEIEIEKNKVELASFIRLLDRYDDRNYLSVMLSYNSFSDFFDQVKYSEDIQRSLQRTLDKIQELNEKLGNQKTSLDSSKKQLDELLEKLQNSRDALDDQKDAKNYLIIETKKSEKKFQNTIAELKKMQDAANAQVAAVERQIRAELSKKGSGEKLNTLGNAILTWPTISHRITCLYHDPDYPFTNVVGQHSGLDIGVKQGTPILAAEAGYVAKAAMGTKWYGNYIMIIHSNNLSTLYGHLSSIIVEQDKYVSKGQIIGYSGNTGFSSGPHLHFEVRSKGIPTDPLKYLP